jgi:hypothetical protein
MEKSDNKIYSYETSYFSISSNFNSKLFYILSSGGLRSSIKRGLIKLKNDTLGSRGGGLI